MLMAHIITGSRGDTLALAEAIVNVFDKRVRTNVPEDVTKTYDVKNVVKTIVFAHSQKCTNLTIT